MIRCGCTRGVSTHSIYDTTTPTHINMHPIQQYMCNINSVMHKHANTYDEDDGDVDAGVTPRRPELLVAGPKPTRRAAAPSNTKNVRRSGAGAGMRTALNVCRVYVVDANHTTPAARKADWNVYSRSYCMCECAIAVV